MALKIPQMKTATGMCKDNFYKLSYSFRNDPNKINIPLPMEN